MSIPFRSLVDRGWPLSLRIESEFGSNVVEEDGQYASCGSGENSDAQVEEYSTIE